jgi:hypothetical protein
MKAYEHENYKEFVLARIKAMPLRGKGEIIRISRAHGDFDLTLEQALDLCQYLGLGELETEYFLTLVQMSRAGNERLKARFRVRMLSLKEQSTKIEHRVRQDRELSESEKATFYSQWYYSGMRIFSAIPELKSPESMLARLNIPRNHFQMALEFLLSTGLCIEKDGKIQTGPQFTHLTADSPLTSRHHANWRQKAMAKHLKLSPNELAYTCAVSLSKKDQAGLRMKFLEMIEDFNKTVAASEPNEVAACLTLDWFEF